MKLLAVVLASLALQALCVQSYSVGNRELDQADKENLATVLRDLGLDKRPIDSNDILTALQNILLAISGQLQNAADALADVTVKAANAGEALVQQAVDGWTERLESLIPVELREALAECEASQPNLQTVRTELDADVQACVVKSSALAQGTLEELRDVEDKSQKLINQAEAAFADCESWGLLQYVCVTTRVPDLSIRGGILAANATILSVKIVGHLAVRVPIDTAACVTASIAGRSAEALGVIANLNQCVLSYQPTTTEAAATDATDATAASSTSDSTSSESTAATSDATQ